MNTKKVFIKGSKANIATIIDSTEATTKLAILCPGYLDTKDYAGLSKLSHELAEYGYTAVRFDPTGTWESDGDISEYSMTQYLNDIESILDYMLAKNTYTETVLIGHSRGGTAALLFASQNKKITKVIGIMSPYALASWEKWGNDGLRLSKRGTADGGSIEFVVPVSFLEDLNTYDVLVKVEKIQVPTFLFAGGEDVGVLPSDVEELYKHLQCSKSFEIIPNVEHDYRKFDEQIKAVNEFVLSALGYSD